MENGEGRQVKGKGHLTTGYEATKGSIFEENMNMELMEVMSASVRRI